MFVDVGGNVIITASGDNAVVFLFVIIIFASICVNVIIRIMLIDLHP